MKNQKLFGTDGVRGLANTGKLTPESVVKLAQAAGGYFQSVSAKDKKPVTALIGRDTRLSGDMIEAALVSGLTSMGINVQLCGIVPTAAVSLITQQGDASFGVMITASHNKFQDNGIKFFGSDGLKLSDQAETDIETRYFSASSTMSEPTETGIVTQIQALQNIYIDHVIKTASKNPRIKKLKIVLDCANGAAFETAPKILSQLGAENVIIIGATPNGRNINADCGSTHTALLSETVKEKKADIGIALDGDADRLIICDERGEIIDGDQLLGVLALSMKKQNRLNQSAIAVTVMSNLGLERLLESHEIKCVRTAVGDRHVAAAMRNQDYNLGGEQSGHILLPDLMPTGDGMTAALQILSDLAGQAQPASDVLRVFAPVPQLLINVRYEGGSPLETERVQNGMKHAQAAFGGNGRILVRASGTEPVIRVMAEGDDQKQVKQIAEDLAMLIKTAS